MAYSVEYECASCATKKKMHVAQNWPIPRPPGDFICQTCVGQLQIMVPPGGCHHSFWGFYADANGDVDLVSCHLCGHIYFDGQNVYKTIIHPPVKLDIITEDLGFRAPPKEGSCTSCGRELCEALDADYSSRAPLTICRPCRSK